jgi:hypothetical protein
MDTWYVTALQRGSATQVDHIVDPRWRTGDRGFSLCGADLRLSERFQAGGAGNPLCGACLAVTTGRQAKEQMKT